MAEYRVLLTYKDIEGILRGKREIRVIDSERVARYREGDILLVPEPFICDDDGEFVKYWLDGEKESGGVKHRSSAYMSRELIRIKLRVIYARIERLQDMIKYSGWGRELMSTKEEYRDFWNDKIGYRRFWAYGWSADPYVQVIGFERLG